MPRGGKTRFAGPLTRRLFLPVRGETAVIWREYWLCREIAISRSIVHCLGKIILQAVSSILIRPSLTSMLRKASRKCAPSSECAFSPRENHMLSIYNAMNERTTRPDQTTQYITQRNAICAAQWAHGKERKRSTCPHVRLHSLDPDLPCASEQSRAARRPASSGKAKANTRTNFGERMTSTPSLLCPPNFDLLETIQQ